MNAFTVKGRPPSYLALRESDWIERIATARALASPCRLCARSCLVMRFERPAPGVLGVCKTADAAVVSSVNAHFGEEPPLVGTGGSGTIFFTHCGLGCLYCQNYDIAHLGRGRVTSDEELAGMMLRVQSMGCHNVNLVTPSHVLPNILAAVRLAARDGLSIPLVWNTGGYDAVDALRLLDGVVDLYMPDMKYGESGPAAAFSNAPDYPQINRAAVAEMHRQAGDLVTDERSVAVRGLLVRHLVLPDNQAGTKIIMDFLAQDISKDTYINIMAQYRPCYRAIGHPLLGRRITGGEYREALRFAKEAGLRRVQTM